MYICVPCLELYLDRKEMEFTVETIKDVSLYLSSKIYFNIRREKTTTNNYGLLPFVPKMTTVVRLNDVILNKFYSQHPRLNLSI